MPSRRSVLSALLGAGAVAHSAHTSLTGARDYTSVSFLVDKKGVIRSIHPGGEYHESGGAGHESCERDYRSLRTQIARLLIE